MRSWNVFHLARRFVWFLRAIWNGEIPTKDVRTIIPLYNTEEAQIEIDKGKTPVYIAWRTCSITRSHFEKLKVFVESNPEYSFYYFNDQLQENWMMEHFSNSPIYQAYLSTPFGACKSDLFRYCLVLTLGGVFASINYLPAAPLSKFLPQPLTTFVVTPSSLPYISLGYEENGSMPLSHRAVAQFWICSAKNHPILKIALELALTRFNQYRGVKFENVDHAIWHLTGPILLTDAVNVYLNAEKPRMNSLTFLDEDFNHCVKRSKQANYRYMFAASYIGYKKSVVYKKI